MDELFPLVDVLMEQNKVGTQKEYTGKKLKSVWAVGEEVLEKAKEISDEVILLDKSTPEEIAQKALKEKHDVILWNADFGVVCEAEETL